MKYNAFISYSHAEDSDLAPNLQIGLEQFAKPLFRKKALDIFRDVSDLSASPDLWGDIEEGLDQSEYFVFLASETAAKSKWCKKEIEHWKATKSMDNFLVVLTSGDLVWDYDKGDFNWLKTNALPKNLTGVFESEPLYVDFRENFSTKQELDLENPRFKQNIVLLAATIHNKSVGDMVGEAALQHKKTIRTRNTVIASLSILLISAVLSAFYAFNQKSEAEHQTNRALLNNYISSIQAEFNEDPTKALRLAEYGFRFAHKNKLPDQQVVKKLIQVFYSGNDFYLESDSAISQLPRDREVRSIRPTEFDCFEGRRVVVDTNDILYSRSKEFAIIYPEYGTASLIEPSLYKYCNYFFPSVRVRKSFRNNRFPINRVFFVNNGKQLLTKSEYWPWNEEEYAPMPDGHMVYTYHLYNTAVYAYLEDFNYKMTDEELKEALLGDLDPKTIGVQWPIEVETRVSSPIKLYSQDSTMYANNLGVYARSGEKLFDFNMPMDDLTSNYRFGFSKDNSFFYVDFIPVAPAIPELNRRFIFPLHPELIIHRINNAHAPMSIAQLTNEDNARFLIE